MWVLADLAYRWKLPFTCPSKVIYLPPLSTFKSPPFSPIPAACGYRNVLQPHLESSSIFISGVPHDLSRRPRKLCQLSHSLPMSILEGSRAQIPTQLSPPHWFQIAARNLSLAGGPLEFQNPKENSTPSQFGLKLTVSAYLRQSFALSRPSPDDRTGRVDGLSPPYLPLSGPDGGRGLLLHFSI